MKLTAKEATYMVFILLLTLAPLISNQYIVRILIVIFYFSVLSEGWNIIGGYTGQISFGHAAFFGVGAYAATLAELYLGYPMLMGIFLGGAVAALFAGLVGYPLLRLKGPYFAIGTLGFAETLRILFSNEERWTGGAAGIIIPHQIYVRTPLYVYYYTALMILLITIICVRYVEGSKFGLSLMATREDPLAAEAMGINITRSKVLAFILSAFFPGLAGGFYANFITYIDPLTVFSSKISLGCVATSILGGSGTILGPMIGSALIISLNEILRGYFAYNYILFYGLSMIVIVLLMPEGIVGALKRMLMAHGSKVKRNDGSYS